MREKTLLLNLAEAWSLSALTKRESSLGQRRRQWFMRAIVVLGCWTFLALLFSPQTYILNSHSNPPLTWWQALQANLALFYVWAALTPLVLWLGHRFSIERIHLSRNLAIHFGLSFAIAFLQLVLLQLVNSLTISWIAAYQPSVAFKALIVGLGATNVMNYWCIVGISQALIYFRRYKEREVSLAQAQLQAIQTQIHPHFLFNTLNAISELVHDDANRAEQTITQLSDLLRISLQNNAAQEVALKEELDFLRKYIDIQQTLLGERLKVEWKIETITLDALVPNLMLQPIIENAIRHGIASKVKGGTIKIVAEKKAENLYLSVEDDGIGINFPLREHIREGIGLKSVRARLRHLYEGSHDFSLTNPPGGQGLCVEMTIPFHEDSAYSEVPVENANRAESLAVLR